MPNRSVREGCLDRHVAVGFIITVIVVFNFVLGSLWQILAIKSYGFAAFFLDAGLLAVFLTAFFLLF